MSDPRATAVVRPPAAVAVVACLAAAASALAQADFSESFDDVGPTSGPGPSGLVAEGWIFRNQSQAPGATVWYQGTGLNYPTFIDPQAGPGYLANASSWDSGNRRISTWAILPPIPGQAAGDLLTLYIAGATTPADRFQVRYSPTGGTNTGTDWDDVGDFTEVLLDSAFPGLRGASWDQVSAEIPGPGRLAIRWFNPDMPDFQSPVIGIDTLTVGAPPCNEPPIPGPGQTVTWTAADGPYRFCDNQTIPAGATIIVEAGVRVDFVNDRQLFVEGTLDIRGTEAAPVVLTAPDNFPPYIEVRRGTLVADFTDFGQQLRVSGASDVHLRDCTFTSDGSIFHGGMLIAEGSYFDGEPFLTLERCTFTNTLATLSDTRTVLIDNTFIGTSPWLLRGYADLSAPNTLIGAPMNISRLRPAQPMLVDGIHASGYGSGPGLQVGGGNFLLGPNNVLENNLYPLGLVGGLLPGSAVPQAGSVVNKILTGEGGGTRLWPDLGVPYLYVHADGTSSSPLRILPGVVVEAASEAFMGFLTSDIEVEGLPDAPILLHGENGALWQGIVFGSTAGTRFEYVDIRNAAFGLIASDVPALYLQNSVLRNNQVGGNANTFGGLFVSGTRLIDNNAGLSVSARGFIDATGGTNPNAFEGNDAAIDAFDFDSDALATGNWWGHPTGPQHPDNPTGQGDRVIGPGAGNIPVLPFLTAPPDFTDHPPVVRLTDLGFFPRPDFDFEPGQKLILSWTVGGDGVVRQDLLLSPEGHHPSAFTIPLAENLPPSQRAVEITLPDVGFAVTNQRQYLRLVATDAAGKQGWDEVPLTISSGNITGDVKITTDIAGQTFYPGDEFPTVQWTGSATGFPSITAFVLLEADGQAIAGFFDGSFFEHVPHASTDAARLAIRFRNNSNDVLWAYADGYFSIRHDPRFGFEPPAVQLQTPTAGATFQGGGVVPITWTASAPEGLYEFDIQASTDGGRTWFLIATDLPPDARSFDWRLPPSTGIPDVRVRVIARDRRLQNSTSGHDRAFSILPGDGPACPADFNADGDLTPADFSAFRGAFLAGDDAADFNADGDLTPADFSAFRSAFLAGCG